jgi:hypothetical protein
MLALKPRNMLNMLAASNPMGYGFAKARLAAFAACFIVYSGIIAGTVALWMWMWRRYHFSTQHHRSNCGSHPDLLRCLSLSAFA